MRNVVIAAELLLRAKLRRQKLVAAELLSPSLIMVLTFVLGWAISTTDRFQVFLYADCTHQLLRAEFDILSRSARRVGIPTCLAPLSAAMESELVRREDDLARARRHEEWRQEQARLAQQRQKEADQKQHQEQQQQQQHRRLQQQEGTGAGEGGLRKGAGGGRHGAGKRGGKRPWRLNWGMLRQGDSLNVTRSPGLHAGRQIVMSLLSAMRRPNVPEALEECRWHDMVATALPPTVMNIMNQLLGPAPLMTFDEWLTMSATLNATLAAAGRRGTVESMLEFLMPVMPVAGMQPGWLAMVPDTPQVRAFAAHMSASSHYFDDVFLGLYDRVEDAMDAAAVARSPAPRAADAWGPRGGSGGAEAAGDGGEPPGDGQRKRLVAPARLWAVLEFASGPELGGGVDYEIRMNAMHVPSTFTKLSAPECKTCSSDFVPYAASGFLSLQAAVSGYVLQLNQGRADNSRSDATAWLPGDDDSGGVEGGMPGAGGALHSAGSGSSAGREPGAFAIWYTPFPNMGQEVNAFYEYGSPLLGLLTTCSFALPLAMMVRAMVSQRQSGLQHLLHVLGLSPHLWQAAWVLAALPVLGAAFALEGYLASSTYLQLVEPGLLAAVMAAAALACTTWGVLLGTVFDDGKVASTGSFVATLVAGMPFFASYNLPPTQLLGARRASCLLWPTALSTLLQRMAAGHQLRRYGPGTVNSGVPGLRWATATHGSLSALELLVFLLLDAALYLALAAALEGWRGRQAGGRGGAGAAKAARARSGGAGALEVSGVSHRYPGAAARTLSDVSLSVAPGKAVALLGRNAAGKTTLVAVSCGRLQPSLGGYVRVGGCVMYGGGGGEGGAYRNLGYCPQGNTLLADLTALEHLQLALVLRGTASPWRRRELRAAADRLAGLVSLPQDMMQDLSHELSGGSKRKLQLAMAMAGEPPVLLLDEVTAGVDAESRQAIWRALVHAKEGPWGAGRSSAGAAKGADGEQQGLLQGQPVGHGAALLFTSHYLGEVAALADRVAVLDAGCIQSETSASLLCSSLRGAHKVLRITTRPPAAAATREASADSAGTETSTETDTETNAPGRPPPVLLTRSQLQDMVLRGLGPGAASVLYSTLTSTAVCVEMSPAAAGAVGGADGGGKGGSAGGPAAASLELLVRDLKAQAQGSRRGGPEGPEQGGSGNVLAALTKATSKSALGPCPPGPPGPPSGNHNPDTDWELQPLVVVRCDVGPPTLEDILLMGAQGVQGAGGPGGGGEGAAGSSAVGAGAPAQRVSFTSASASAAVDGQQPALGSRDPSAGPVLTSSSEALPPHRYSHSSATARTTPSARSAGSLLADLSAALLALLLKHLLQWRRDWRSLLRLLLLPVLAVALASLALSIRPASKGPPAPLHLGWLGQDQPTPATSLPYAWRRLAAEAAASGLVRTQGPHFGNHREGGAEDNATLPGGGLWAGAATVAAEAEAEAEVEALDGLGLVPLLSQWVRAATVETDATGTDFVNSYDVSFWFMRANSRMGLQVEGSSREGKAVAPLLTAAGLEEERLAAATAAKGYGQEPEAPLQAALVFRDSASGEKLVRTGFKAAGWLLRTVLVPTDADSLGLPQLPQLQSFLQALTLEEGALHKTFDFLYDRMLMHEFISTVKYILRAAKKSGNAADLGEPALNLTKHHRSLLHRDLLAGGGGGGDDELLSFFTLGRMVKLCNLTVPPADKSAGVKGGAGSGGGGGRTLQMSYRPPLNIAVYLLAGFLPLEPRFCPLARLMVEQSHRTTEVGRRYLSRRLLPAVTLMWNISSPHGLPAALNHLHNTMLVLSRAAAAARGNNNNSNGTAAPGSAAGGSAAGGAGSGRGRGSRSDRRAYSQEVYGRTGIRVRNHPLPPRGTTTSFAGFVDHLLLAVMIALPLTYTTGSFVVRSAQEAASGAKEQQLAAGRCSPLAYWLSCWCCDLALHGGIIAAVVGLLWAGGTEAFTGTAERNGGLLLLLLGFAAASLPWGYCIGLRCATPAAAQGLVSNAGLVTGVGLALARQVLSHVRKYSWLATRMLPVLRLLPPFCLVDGLVQLSLLDVILALSEVLGKNAAKRGFFRSIMEGHLVGIDPEDSSPFQTNVLGANLAYLAFDTLLYGTVLLTLEWRASRGDPLPTWLRGGPAARVRAAFTAAAATAAAAATVGRQIISGRRGAMRPVSGKGRGGGGEEDDSGFVGDSAGGRNRRRAMTRGTASWRPLLGPSSGGGGDQGGPDRVGTQAERDAELEAEWPPLPRPDCLVRVCNVHMVYGNGTAALRGLTFGLQHGECLALIGRNGAGKTTALAVLAGRLRPSSGSVSVGGVELAGRPDAARRRVAMCPQTNPLLPLLSPTEHLALYIALHGPGEVARSVVIGGGGASAGGHSGQASIAPQIADMAWQCGLTRDLMDRPAGLLSGGTQRKLSLAIALLGRPQLLLLDEPSAGMDPPARRAMCDTINMAIRGRGGGGGSEGRVLAALPPAVVLTTHYGEEALALCDRVGVMEGGRLLAYGAPEVALRSLPHWHYLADPEEWGGVLPELG